MKPKSRHELETIGCLVLFVLVILALVAWALYERGYLGVAVAVVGGVAVSIGLIREVRARVTRRRQGRQRRRRQQEERQERPRREQYRLSEDGEPPACSAPKERRKEEERLTDRFERDALVQRLSELSDEEFKRLMAYYFRHRGYTVETTPASGDRDADLIIAADDRRIAVLLKRQDGPVGEGGVREALAGRAFYGTYEAWIVTNDTFTRAARHDAGVAGVRLIDGDELARWLDELLEQVRDEPSVG